MNLEEKFKLIKKSHREDLRKTEARVVLAPSVMRACKTGTKEKVKYILERIDIDYLRSVRNQTQFKRWFCKNLKTIVKAIKDKNKGNNRVGNGYGLATKVLALYVRGMVLNRRYFTDKEVCRIEKWLYTPIDSVVIKELKRRGEELPFDKIKDIDQESFYQVQERLGGEAAKVGIPRIWFDDNVWGARG